MKATRAIFLLSLITYAGSGSLLAQFAALPDHSARWLVQVYDGPNLAEELSYFLSDTPGDTLIDSETFTKLFFGLSPLYPFGALRDNGLGQVYYHSFSDNLTHLLYDFAVSPGDTINGVYNEPYFINPLYVTGVDSVQYAGSWRRRIGLSESSSSTIAASYWVQGIGGVEGAVWSGGPLSTCACTTVSMAYRLFCASVSDTIQYGFDAGYPGHCFLSIDVGENFFEEDPITAFPNPSTGQFTLSPSQKANAITVYTPTGQQLIQSTGQTIDLSAYPPGLYHALVRTAQGEGHVRLMVQR